MAILEANRGEEEAMLRMSKAVMLISDPDLMVPVKVKPNEKLTMSQRIAKKKQEEMAQLLRSFVTNQSDLLRFSKSVTEVNNKNEDVVNG